jgi:hypothetical protein
MQRMTNRTGTIRRQFTIEAEREVDGREIAEVLDLAGVVACGQHSMEVRAITAVQALAPRALADLVLL